MPVRFFVDHVVDAAAGMMMDGALATHVAGALRMHAGDVIVVVDRARVEHGVRLREVGRERCTGDVLWSRDATGEPRLRITVLQALPRERMEDCVDILVEAGAAAIQPVLTERIVSRAAPDRLAARVRRWQAVATESAQLAGRGIIPTVNPPLPLTDALAGLEPGSRLLACSFEGERSIADVDVEARRPLALCIGPEGGLSPAEVETLRSAGGEIVHMGERVMRTRYAGAVACALVLAAAGDLDHGPVTAPDP